jgi:preprotein translocase subunit SecG
MKYVRVGLLVACAALISPVAVYAKSGTQGGGAGSSGGGGKSSHSGANTKCKAGQKSTTNNPCS